MSEIVVTDQSPVLLSCGFLEGGTLDVRHEVVSLAAQDLAVELDQVASTQIAVTDFVYAGESYRTSVFSVAADGTLSAWARNGSSMYSPVLPAGDEETVLHAAVVVASYDESLTPDEQAVYKPTSGYAQVRIRVRKKGSKPFI